ncbi:MAG TPA: CbiQ family ECF transporter T component, partial [Terrimesophilobacter sp.]|nr:CbiQ family ECF transporter T component [Terrimesophilobacter sp.]
MSVHPLAWWVWALGLAAATTQASDIASTVLLIAAVVAVVAVRRDSSLFARAFPLYLALAGGVVVIRVLFYVLVGIKSGTDVILPLPRIRLPEWAAGIALLGPVTGSGLLAALAAGLALAALLICFGAAVALTDPQRTLRALPASLHLLGTPAVIAMTLAPQLVTSWRRVRRAQVLRGRTLRGRRAVAATTLPVLEDALERSLSLAASMDSRGYARVHRGNNRWVLLVTALVGVALGTYALLGGTGPGWWSLALFAVASLGAVTGALLASRGVTTTRYRRDEWGPKELLTAGAGVAVAVVAFAADGVVAFVVCAILALTPIAVSP